MRSFLLETSVLEQLSGPLCDVLTGRSDSQAMLEYLERANLFLVPLDEERHWYRYHHLFADLLLACLKSADPERVLELHREADQVILNREIAPLHNPAPAERARLLLAQGEVREAARWVEKRGLEAEDEPDYAHELEYLLLARTLLSHNMAGKALPLLEHLEAAAKTQGRLGSLIEIQLLRALGLQAVGKTIEAVNVLAEALMQAEPEGYIRTFVDEGPPMAALLHHTLSRRVMVDYTTELLAAFPAVDQGIEPSPRPVTFSFNEPLSERELEVLHLLASGASKI